MLFILGVALEDQQLQAGQEVGCETDGRLGWHLVRVGELLTPVPGLGTSEMTVEAGSSGRAQDP